MEKHQCRVIGLACVPMILMILASACAARNASSGEPGGAGRSFDAVIRQGGLYLNQMNYDKAVAQFNQALRLNPESPKAHNLRGLAYFQQKEYARAEQDFLKAVALNGSYAEAYNNLGGVYFLKKQYALSKEMFLKSLSITPDSVPSLYSLGTLLIYLNQPEEGHRVLGRGMELDPEFLLNKKTFFADISSSGLMSAGIYFAYAELFASKGNAEKTLEFLKKAELAGFREWRGVLDKPGFEKVREDPGFKEFFRRKI